MRLLHSSTLELAEFANNVVPPYAILSHTWEEEEVSFQDMHGSQAATKKGYEKIKKCCEIAASDGFEYAWVDTCCIDKTSSSELSEAINSMWAWYKKAEVCYAYLSDVPYINELHLDMDSLAKSRWFTRGWTLQELIAPVGVIFYSQCWREIGTRSSLRGSIHSITRIHERAFSGGNISYFSIAQRMSWASNRQTSRVEDIAYCLMGIFSVNMPMLYGEGSRAFIRLQEEIIKKSDDQSILAWRIDHDSRWFSGLLASSPTAFRASHSIVRAAIARQSGRLSNEGFEVTNKGMHMTLPLRRHDNGLCSVVLDCTDSNYYDRNVVTLQLHQIPQNDDLDNGWNYQRSDYSSLWPISIQEACSHEYQVESIHVELEYVRMRLTGYIRSSPPRLKISARLKAHGFEKGNALPQPNSVGPRGELDFTYSPIPFRKVLPVSSSLGHFSIIISNVYGWSRLKVKIQNTIGLAVQQEEETDLADTKEPPDRIVWPLSGGSHMLLVAIRDKMIEGKKIQEIELDVCERD